MENPKGKNEDALAVSREIRGHLISKYGILPESVIAADWSIRTDRRGQKSYIETRRAGANWNTPFTLSDVHRGSSHSDFPHNLCRFLIQWLTVDKLKEPGYFHNYLPTVFDPFAGHNSRMEDAFITHRNYVAHDICHEFMEANREIRDSLLSKGMFSDKPVIMLVEGDSRDINYTEEFDFSITSPPFWDLENYGPETGQLANQITFNDFMWSLGQVFKNVHKALKPLSFFVVECNDFRRQGVFYTFHSSVIDWLKRVGFSIHDIIICDYRRSMLIAFASEMEQQKITGKRHSYFIVAHKGFEADNIDKVRERLMEETKTTPKRPADREQLTMEGIR